ncbi:MAG: hypothetical protein H6661_04475 [Ardenticatenaceae bacterium]|nr:hypothetical protein [Ardenticatenaceae bacterium]
MIRMARTKVIEDEPVPFLAGAGFAFFTAAGLAGDRSGSAVDFSTASSGDTGSNHHGGGDGRFLLAIRPARLLQPFIDDVALQPVSSSSASGSEDFFQIVFWHRFDIGIR